MDSRILVAAVALGLIPSVLTLAQQPPTSSPDSHRIYLDVVVAPKSGPPVAGLQKQDFTVLDNKASQPIATFSALGGPQAPVEVVLLVDAVNSPYSTVSYEREQIDKFLKADGGHLAHPVSLAVFTDTGTKIQQGPSSNGNEVSAALDQSTIALREIHRDSQYEAIDRLQLGLKALHDLATQEANRPGRKIIMWVSPGWPLLSGPEVTLDSKETQQIFSQIVDLSTLLRRGRITLYSINPLGAAAGVGRDTYYEEFLKGVSKSGQAQLGDLGLQVLAVQSGGLALTGDNDISGLLARCMADTKTYYELSFDAPRAEHPDEYHQLLIQVAKPGLTARTRTGYYAQP